PDTVNTIPPPTLTAFRDHGRPRASLTEDLDGAFDTMRTLAETGISLKATTDALLADGIQAFVDAFRKLLAAVEAQSRGTGATRIQRRFDRVLPPEFEAALKVSVASCQAQAEVRRI